MLDSDAAMPRGASTGGVVSDPASDAASGPGTAEHRRLAEATGRAENDLFTANPWYEWGPYLSERAWGTVRGLLRRRRRVAVLPA